MRRTPRLGVRDSMLAFGCESVLLVEDEPDLLAILGDLFEDDGLETHRASSGAQALAMLRAGLRPDIAFVDLLMPGMRGEELVAAIRSDPALRDMKVAVMTAKRMKWEVLREVGADDVVEKPFSLERLNEVLASLCRKPRTGTAD